MSEEVGKREDGADRLNEIGVLMRREIEARVVGPLLDALGREFGRERVVEIAREVIVGVAREQGAQLAEAMGGNSLAHFAGSMAAWKKGDAMEIDVLAQDEDRYHFNVTRCRYAEMYRALGLEDLGATLSCNRDAALIEGFNPQVTLTRTRTILQGASHCDFRFDLTEKG
ncbi:MAG: L-2-amino-thiazoline-4-carboxylic acid hydrolase [Blastocatellia bacterium]|nr:L-2-amino-thiazoline-4-carboxylic acid hydrolase [Blastocatellia bacterium]